MLKGNFRFVQRIPRMQKDEGENKDVRGMARLVATQTKIEKARKRASGVSGLFYEL